MKPCISKVIAGGFLGTLAMTLMMNFVAPRMGVHMDIAAMLGSMLGGRTMGMFIHFLNGTVIFPLIYTYVLYRVLPGSPATRGVVFGVLLWLAAQLMVMPLMGAGLFSLRAGGVMAATASLLGHVVYGGLLGFLVGGTCACRTAGSPGVARAS